MKSCAIELAEQNLVFLRNACCINRDKLYQCKLKLEQLKKCLMNFTEDQETMLTLKMSQLCVKSNDSPKTDKKDAVLTPRKHARKSDH